MDNKTAAEQIIADRIRNNIEQRGRMPSGSLEWHGADVEAFSAAVIVAMATCDTPDALMIALKQARDLHITAPMIDIETRCKADDIADDFDMEDRAAMNRSRIAAAAFSGVAL